MLLIKLITVGFLLLPSEKRYLHAAFDVYACMHFLYTSNKKNKNMLYHEVTCRAAAAIGRMAAVRAGHHQMVVARKGGMIVGHFMCSR